MQSAKLNDSQRSRRCFDDKQLAPNDSSAMADDKNGNQVGEKWSKCADGEKRQKEIISSSGESSVIQSTFENSRTTDLTNAFNNKTILRGG